MLDCLTKKGKTDEILTFVKETKEFLSQLPSFNQFKAFFPEWVMSHALSLGPESGSQKEKLLLELEAYLMHFYRGQDNNPRRRPSGYRTCLSQGIFPHLFKCLAQLGRYASLHGIVTEINSFLQDWTIHTDITLTLNQIESYVHLPSALATSVKDMDFVVKEALMEETLGLARTLVQMALDLGAYETIRKLRIDPMQGLINFCFETGMVHELTGFLQELEESLVAKYGMDRIGLITTTILYFEERVADGLEHVGPTNMTFSDWSVFLEQLKSCVIKWTQLISTPQHVHEKKGWMEGIAEFASRRIDTYIEG